MALSGVTEIHQAQAGEACRVPFDNTVKAWLQDREGDLTHSINRTDNQSEQPKQETNHHKRVRREAEAQGEEREGTMLSIVMLID